MNKSGNHKKNCAARNNGYNKSERQKEANCDNDWSLKSSKLHRQESAEEQQNANMINLTKTNN